MKKLLLAALVVFLLASSIVLIQDDLQEVVYGYQLSYIDGQLGIVAASALAEGQTTSA